MKLAVIPARGGSKRIPRKNIKLFCGKPMIAWSIEAARRTGLFDRIIVSTDDREIAYIAKKYGAEVPFMRPAELSDDYVGTTPVIKHAIQWHLANAFDLQYVCCIYPTAPLIDVADIRRGLRILETTGAKFTFSVTSYAFPIQRALKIRNDGVLDMFYPNEFNTRSQDLTEAYHDAGQFYWGSFEAWLEGGAIFSNMSAPVIIPRYRVQDIDTQEDWQQAEYLWKVSNAQ